MDIRLTGTETECAEVVDVLRTTFQLRAVSRFYTNRGDTILGRVYVDAEPLPAEQQPTGPVQATAERTDRPKTCPQCSAQPWRPHRDDCPELTSNEAKALDR